MRTRLREWPFALWNRSEHLLLQNTVRLPSGRRSQPGVRQVSLRGADRTEPHRQRERAKRAGGHLEEAPDHHAAWRRAFGIAGSTLSALTGQEDDS